LGEEPDEEHLEEVEVVGPGPWIQREEVVEILEVEL